MTVHVLGEVAIGDLDRFLEVFGSAGHDKRAQHGCQQARVFRPSDENGRVLVLLRWPDRAAFDAFRADPDVPGTMARGGATGPPSFTVLDEVAEFDA